MIMIFFTRITTIFSEMVAMPEIDVARHTLDPPQYVPMSVLYCDPAEALHTIRPYGVLTTPSLPPSATAIPSS